MKKSITPSLCAPVAAIALAAALSTAMFSQTAFAADPFIKAGGESDPRFMMSLRTSFIYSMFSPAIGFGARLTGYTPIWNTNRATGTFDVGLHVNYANGGKFMYPWIQDTAAQKMNGADHNTRLALSVGHSLYFGESRRHQFGVHFFTGASFTNNNWCVEYPDEGLSKCSKTSFTGLTFGPELEYTYRFHRNIGFHLMFGGAFGAGVGGPAGQMVHIGTGLTFFML